MIRRHAASLVLAALIGAAVGLPSATARADDADFQAATRAPYTPPPEKSINGKSIAEMKANVEKLWGQIVLESGGKPVRHVATLQTTAGDIEIEFYGQDAPSHVRSFIALSKAGFFDGLIFHRCIPGFVIQGGCPKGNGTGGPGYCLKPEFNAHLHKRGVLSMARAQPTDSAGSQFFICVGDAPFLNGKYTAFGEVTKGMDVADKIVNAPRNAADRPDNPVTIKSVKVAVQEGS